MSVNGGLGRNPNTGFPVARLPPTKVGTMSDNKNNSS